MEQEIKDLIEKQLPAQVGEVLRKRLEQADEDAAKVRSLKSEVDDIRAKNREHLETISSLSAQLSRHSSLDRREEDVEKRERAIELEIAKCRADNAERGKNDLFQLVGTIFKNTTVRETLCKSHFSPMTGQTANESGTVTREVE